MTINLYPVIYWSILESLGVLNNFIGVERNCFCVIQKSQIYIALSLQQTHLITLYVAIDNNDDEEDDISLGDKTEYNKTVIQTIFRCFFEDVEL